MGREKKLLLNTTFSLLNQVIVIICGFILPRFILKYYGSTINGLITSISQFLGFISLCECGIGAVVQSSLYKPLADNNKEKVNEIYKSATVFFQKIAIILIVYTIFLMFFFPNLVVEIEDKKTIIILILAISINYFSQYYFGMTNKILLNADQLGFIQYGINSIILIINVIIAILLMYFGANVTVMKITSSIVFIVQPIYLNYFVNRKYKINKKIKLTTEPIQQKWNGLAQHVATVILTNTDIVILTIFSSLGNVSIYGVYNLIVIGLKQLVISLTAGVQSLLGNMYARKDILLNDFFNSFEVSLHIFITLIFGITLRLIIPFVNIYTKGIEDINYIIPSFAILITIAQATYCYRLPYSLMILAAGHYKQTQSSAIIEVIINIILSIAFVKYYGLIGVTIGTIIAMLYRTCYFAVYLSKNIINRNLKYFIKNLMVDIFSILIMYISTSPFKIKASNFIEWIETAFIVSIICIIETIIINLIFNFKFIKKYIKFIQKKFFNKE